jgi:uncharacterized membrane protein YdbT with pleckstrin-like domain
VLALGGMMATVFGAFMVTQVLQPINLMRRLYFLYDDVVEYEDTFLTRTRAVIPMENLADVSIRQGIAGRVFGVADVHLSCQGAGGTILFRLLPSAQQFRDNLESLIRGSEEAAPQVSWEAGVAAPLPSAGATRARPRLAAGAPLVMRSSLPRIAFHHISSHLRSALGAVVLIMIAPWGVPHLAELGVDATPALPYAGTVLLVVGVLIGLSLVKALITSAVLIRSVRYRVGDGKVTSDYALVSRSETEFTADKVTSVRLSHSLVDRLFGTCTIQFYSIGSRQPLVFHQVKDGQRLAGDVLERLGIRVGEPERAVPSSFSIPCFVALHAGSVTVATLLMAGGLVMGGRGEPLWFLLPGVVALMGIRAVVTEYIHSRFQRVELHADYLVGVSGILRRVRQYTSLEHLRHISSRQYPFSSRGTLTVVAGGTPRWSLAYAPHVQALHDELDEVLYLDTVSLDSGAPAFEMAVVDQRRPALRNRLPFSLTWVAVAAAITVAFPLALFLLAFLVLQLARRVVAVRRTRYAMEKARLTGTSGILYRTRRTVLLDRLDHLRSRQGLLNKVFRNGTVSIFTTGSGGADMVCRDVPRHEAWYAEIERRLQQGPGGRRVEGERPDVALEPARS